MTNPPKTTNEFPDMQPEQRLRNLILYIAKLSLDDQFFGKVKLAKLLYFADRESYRQQGKPLTGMKYIKLQNGPVPDQYGDAIAEMVSSHEIHIRREPIPDHKDRERIIALADADLSQFSGQDIAIVVDTVEKFRHDSGTRLSELAHGMAWKLAEYMQPIPYEWSLFSDEGITDDDAAHIQKLIEQYGDEL